jgi:hypothetical protein
LVFRRVVGKLIVTYFTPGSDKVEVLSLMSKMLNFSEDQKQILGLGQNPKGLLPIFFFMQFLISENQRNIWIFERKWRCSTTKCIKRSKYYRPLDGIFIEGDRRRCN